MSLADLNLPVKQNLFSSLQKKKGGFFVSLSQVDLNYCSKHFIYT